MAFIQEAAVDLSRGLNFIPQRMRYRLPINKDDTSVYLLSSSYEYDVELIKTMPLPKIDYKNIIIPYRITNTIPLSQDNQGKSLHFHVRDYSVGYAVYKTIFKTVHPG